MPKIDTQHYRDDLDQLRSRFQDLYVKRMPILKEYEKLASGAVHSLLGESMPEMQALYGQAKQIGDAYTSKFLPATERYLASAEAYDTPERRMEAQGRAMADVTTAGETARAGALQRLESYGIDPSQTRGAALDQNLRVQTALEAVKQGRDAALDVEERGRAYVSEALDKGASLPGTSAGLAGTAANIGTQAVGTANQTSNLWANIYGTPAENIKARQDLINSGVDAKARETELKIAAKGAKSNTAGQIGSAVGMAAGAGLGATTGNPMAILAGANMGSRVGNAAFGGSGGGGGMSFTYAPSGGGGSATGMMPDSYWMP